MSESELSYLGKIDEGAVGDAKAHNLIEWFNKGADGKIRWGTPGDFDACVSIAAKHMPLAKAKGFCANRHHTVTGEWPGPDAHKSEGTQMTGMAYGWAPITKIEDQPDGTVIVHGPMSSTGLDRDRQRFSQEFLDRAIPLWFGESGNIREQHDPKRAVGNALQVKRDDATGVWDLAAHVVDTEAVKKIRNKVLKGFSVGVKGPHVTYGKADAPGGEIDDGIICETSVVDRPSNPVTIFQVVKSDGDGDELLFEPGDGLIEKAITHAPAGSPGGGQFLPGGVAEGGGSGLDETRKGAAKVAVTGGGGGKAGGGGGAKKAAKKAAPAKITPAQRAAAAQAKRDQAAAVRAAAAKVRAAQAATKASQAAAAKAAKAAATPAGKAQQAAGKAHPTSITPGPLVRPAATTPAPNQPAQKTDEMTTIEKSAWSEAAHPRGVGGKFVKGETVVSEHDGKTIMGLHAGSSPSNQGRVMISQIGEGGNVQHHSVPRSSIRAPHPHELEQARQHTGGNPGPAVREVSNPHHVGKKVRLNTGKTGTVVEADPHASGMSRVQFDDDGQTRYVPNKLMKAEPVKAGTSSDSYDAHDAHTSDAGVRDPHPITDAERQAAAAADARVSKGKWVNGKFVSKADEADGDEFEGSGDVDPTEDTEQPDEGDGEDDEMANDPRVTALIEQAEAMQAMLEAQADEIAGLAEKLDQVTSEAEVAKVDEPGLIKAAVAEVGTAYEGRLATIEAELTKALAMPAPGGPVQMRTSTQAVLAQAREKADVRAQIDELTTKADQFRTSDRELADGYDERARRLMRTLNG